MFALQPEMKVFSGSANRELAQRICDVIGVPLGAATISSFPDGETYVKIEETFAAAMFSSFSRPVLQRINT
jgi:ribose-phosphate pyrophosphokinase